MEIESCRTALFGRCCLTLKKIDKSPLKGNFKVGDEANLYSQKLSTKSAKQEKISNEFESDKSVAFCLISKVTANAIEVVMDEFDESSGVFESPLRLDVTSSRKTFTKMNEALQQLETASHPLVDVLFSPPSSSIPINFLPSSAFKLEKVCNPHLNPSQLDAITTAISAPKLALIHGPVSKSLYLLYTFIYRLANHIPTELNSE